jgi:hypothetical protein
MANHRRGLSPVSGHNPGQLLSVTNEPHRLLTSYNGRKEVGRECHLPVLYSTSPPSRHPITHVGRQFISPPIPIRNDTIFHFHSERITPHPALYLVLKDAPLLPRSQAKPYALLLHAPPLIVDAQWLRDGHASVPDINKPIHIFYPNTDDHVLNFGTPMTAREKRAAGVYMSIESHLNKEAMEEEVQLETDTAPLHHRIEYVGHVKVLVRLTQDVSGVVGETGEMPPLKLPQGVKVGNAGSFVAYALQVNSCVEHAELHFILEGD